MEEDSGPGDWFGLLHVASDRGTIESIEAIGPGASYLALSWDPVAGTVAIHPGAAADYEAFVARGLEPRLDFSLRAVMRNGRVDTDSPGFSIGLLDRDDTPPTALGFATGGSLHAGAIGAVIGTLQVVDPDTRAGAFQFSFSPEDDWRFEVVNGTTLKLRDGITLGLDDIPHRPLFVTVSDGVQSAGFTLDLTVLDPDAPPPPSRLLAEGETRGALSLPEAGRALVLRDAADLLDLGAPVGGERSLMVRGEVDAALPAATGRIDFLDARLELGDTGAAAQAAALQQVLEGDAADPAALARMLAGLEAGAALVDQAAVPAAGDATAFVADLFRLGAGRDPSAEELALQLGRLGSGESRAQVAVDVALLLAAAAPAEAIWLPWSHGRDSPAADAALPAALDPPPFAADLLLG